jgi:hypothetical protein
MAALFIPYRDSAQGKPTAWMTPPSGWLAAEDVTTSGSGGDPKEGALFYEESSGKFDSIPAK